MKITNDFIILENIFICSNEIFINQIMCFRVVLTSHSFLFRKLPGDKCCMFCFNDFTFDSDFFDKSSNVHLDPIGKGIEFYLFLYVQFRF